MRSAAAFVQSMRLMADEARAMAREARPAKAPTTCKSFLNHIKDVVFTVDGDGSIRTL